MSISVYLLSFLLLISCEIKTVSTGEVKGNGLQITDSLKFIPDISVNGIFLEEHFTVESQIGDLMQFINREESLPSVYVFNNDSSQYLKLIFHPGGVKNSFSEFEVSYVGDLQESKGFRILRFKEFITDSEIKLGMSKQDIIKRKGSDFFEIKEDYIKYIVDDFGKSIFLKKYNMPLYYAKYEFDSNNVLTKYSFGFEYP